MEENEQFTNISPSFFSLHFLALEWDISQDKIWIRSILLVSNISHFYKIYGRVLLGWEQCWWITPLCLHFSLILAASLGSPAPWSPLPDKLLPFDSVHCAQCCPHHLCPSVISFVISYLRSARRAICVTFRLLLSGWCRDYLLSSCADQGSASVSRLPGGKGCFLQAVHPDLNWSFLSN